MHAAAGGVGLWLCQILRAKGARVIATAGTREKRELAVENGASVACGYGREEVVGKVRECTGGEGVRAVFDGVGKETFELSLECVGRKGSLISFGNASGAVEPFAISCVSFFLNLSRLCSWGGMWSEMGGALFTDDIYLVLRRRLAAKNIKVARPTLFNYIYTREEFEYYANELFEMMSKDKFKVRIHEIYPLEEVARAHNVGLNC